MSYPPQPQPPQTVRQEATGRGTIFPTSSLVTTNAPNLFPKSWQIGGVTQITTSVPVPGMSSGATATIATSFGLAPSNQSSPFAFPLTPIALALGQAAFILVSVFLTPPVVGSPVASPFFGLPYVRLSFLGGTPAMPGNTGSLFLLQGPNTYAAPTVTVTLPVYAPATFSTTSVLLTVEAFLVGVPS